MKRSRRNARAVSQAQFEFPAFAAGMCRAHIERALFLVARQIERYGRTALLDSLIAELCTVQREIVTWQAYARLITDRDAAEQAVREERE